MTNTPTIGSWAAWFAIRKLQNAGCDIRQLLQDSGLEGSDVVRTNDRIEMRKNLMLFELGALSIGNEKFGIELGKEFDMTIIGPVAYAMKASSTLVESLSVYTRFHSLVMDAAAQVAASGENGDIVFELTLPRLAGASNKQFSSFAAAAFAANFSRLAGKKVAPTEIGLPFAYGGHVAEVCNLLGAPISFGHKSLRICLSADAAALALPSQDRGLRTMMLNYCEDLMNSQSRNNNAFFRELEKLVLEMLPLNGAKTKVVAAKLGVSERTLQRRFAENKLSYSAFVDGLRHELAIEHLQKNEMSLGEIGFALGYASQSAFQTAFKRWTGKPPSQYRKQIRAARSLG